AAGKHSDAAARRAEEALVRRADGDPHVVVGVVGAAAVEDVATLHVGEDLESPAALLGRLRRRLTDTEEGRGVLPGRAAVGQLAERIVVVVEGQADLLEIVDALRACGRLADLL